MTSTSKTIVLSVRDNDHCKRLADPVNRATFHLETLLPFTEAVKLERGNANVRPASEGRKPFKEMVKTVTNEPEIFHLKNRGITYLCDRFEFDNAAKKVTVHIPNSSTIATEEDLTPRFGIADGGHTFSVIEKTVEGLDSFKQGEGWTEPFVRVHFLSGEGSNAANIEGIVEALNTSSQVQQYTLDEFQNKFDPLKVALTSAGFSIDLVAFRENEEKEWHVIEIIQRMACFLKDRWQETHPASMYKSKNKALELFTNDSTQAEFARLFDVLYDVITLPELIQSRLSLGLAGGRVGKVRGVKPLKAHTFRKGTKFPYKHEMDMAILLPMASAFRELLQLKGERYVWRIRPEEVFMECAERLYNALLKASKKVRIISHLGTDMEYWGDCAQIVMRTQTTMLEQRIDAKS